MLKKPAVGSMSASLSTLLLKLPTLLSNPVTILLVGASFLVCDVFLCFAYCSFFLIRQALHSQLWEGLDDVVCQTLLDYLSVHDVGEEDPILVVEYLPALDTVSTHTHRRLMLVTTLV